MNSPGRKEGKAMAEKEDVKRIAGTSDAALKAKTGKTWDEWFAILEAGGAMEMEHPEIARYLNEQHGVPGWWTQKITGGYEQERKGRQKHQMPRGYQVSVSKTINVPVAELFAAWSEAEAHQHWLKETGIQVRKATQNKSVRMTWIDGQSSLEVLFTAKGEQRSQVSLQHSMLPGAAEAEQMKAYWAEALNRLKTYLEK
jgi:uncharacterized protein YndB with AHSA1/START domain